MRVSNKVKVAGSFVLSLVVSAVLVFGNSGGAATIPYVTERVNLTPGGTQTGASSINPPIISQDGRYVAFVTSASDLVVGDTNGRPDIFIRDRKLNTTVRGNLSSTGAELPNGGGGTMSANGRFVIFGYKSAGVVPGSVNGKVLLYLRDMKNNTTERVDLTTTGALPNDDISYTDISADGRYIVFGSSATNIVPGDTNNMLDVFVKDRKTGTIEMLSKSSGGLSNGTSIRPTISCDGAYVAFQSDATNLVDGDTNGKQDVFLVDRVNGDAVSNITSNANDGSVYDMDLSCNGETLIFSSYATNLVPGDTNGALDIFAYSLTENTIQRVNVDSLGNESSMSAGDMVKNNVDFSGRYVVFRSNASDLVSGDINNKGDIFLRDLVEGTTQIVSKRNSTTQTTEPSIYPAISLDGKEIVYTSRDAELVGGDTNSSYDVFVTKIEL